MNDRVLPSYGEYALNVLRILTHRATGYSGKVEHHAFQRYLSIEDIAHKRTKAPLPSNEGHMREIP